MYNMTVKYSKHIIKSKETERDKQKQTFKTASKNYFIGGICVYDYFIQIQQGQYIFHSFKSWIIDV